MRGKNLLQITGLDEFIKVSLDALKAQCQSKLEGDVDNHVDGGLPDDITNNLCSNDCSNQGTCVNGK